MHFKTILYGKIHLKIQQQQQKLVLFIPKFALC